MIGLFRFTVFFSIIFSSKVFVKNQAEIFKGGFTSLVKKITTTATSRKICNANFCEELIGVLGESISPNEASGFARQVACHLRTSPFRKSAVCPAYVMRLRADHLCLFCFPFFAVSWRSDDALFTHSFPPNGFLIALQIVHRAGLDGITPPQ